MVENINSSNGEDTIDLSHRPDISRPEEPEEEKNENGVIEKDRFKQYSDEELEKFVKFVKPDKVVDDTTKVEYLRACLTELKSMIQDLRRVEKDPLIADLLLRAVAPKIDFYAQTRDVSDYNRVIKLMKEAQKEIEECSTQVTTNFAQDILKELKFQGITMKKM